MEKIKQIIKDAFIYRDEMKAIGRGIDLDSFLKSYKMLHEICKNCGDTRKDLEGDGKIRCAYCGNEI